jgi:serine/threonine-protein kinase PRP4
VAALDAGFEAAVAEVVAGGGAIAVAAAPVSVGASGALVARHAALATGSQTFVEIKVLRAQEVLRAAGEREGEVLRALATADPRGRYHTVRLLHVFEHAGHLCLAFEALAANLKEVADKFGKGVGLPLAAVRVYGAQLLLALGLLRRLGYVHGDLKPHNILADAGYGTIKLADFGSSFREDAPEAEPAPYVGSRFYRAPEAILGARHTPALDMWAAGCVLFELYTGEPLLAGRSNNDMLYRVQCLFGRFPHKMLRRHLAHAAATGAEAHFDDALRFRRAVADPVTREPGVRLCDFTTPTESLAAKLAAARAGDSRQAVAAFQALLEGMLAPDPARRITPADALAHAFIKTAPKK